jgi:HlyD family secretion protein
MSVATRRMITWGIVGVAIVVGLIMAMAPRPVQVDLETVESGPMMVTLDHEGKSRVRDRFIISAPVAGRVQRIVLEPGDPVVANETVLAVFQPGDPALLDSRTRAEAEANVSAAEAAVETARAQRARVQAQTDFAEVEVRRLSSLAERRIIADRMLEAAEAEAQASREALVAAISVERAAEHQLDAARARLLEPADGNSSDGPQGGGTPLSSAPSIHLRSPIDGVVLRRLRQSEAVVPMGEPLLEVADPADLEVVADFLSTDAVRMQPGLPALIDQWGGDEVLRGQVRRIEPAGFMKISALGVEEQRVNVVVDFEDARDAWESLGDEYRVEVRVVIWQSDDVLKVPTSSLFRHGDGWAVFAVADGEARLLEVEVGHRTGLHGEVLSGLGAGDQVIAHPPESIADGVRVEQR